MKRFNNKFLIVFLSFLMLFAFGSLVDKSHYVFGSQQYSAIDYIIDEKELIISPGVTERKIHAKNSEGVQRISVLSVDLEQEHLSLISSIPSGGYPSMEKLSNQASYLTRPNHTVIGGVNGDFYNTSTGQTVGLYIHDGEILNIGSRQRPALGITADGKPIIGYQQLLHELNINGHTMNIEQTNESVVNDGLSLFTEKHDAPIELNDDMIALKLENIDGNLNEIGSVSTTGKIIKDGEITIEEDTLIIVGSGVGKDLLIDNIEEVNGNLSIHTRFNEPWNDVIHAVGGNLILVESGEIAALANDTFNQTVAPRTAAGIKADGTIFFVVIDGRMPGYSEGVNIFELAEMMLDMGAVEAINLDGGGSSTMLTRAPGNETVSVSNRPSDFDDGSERKVANGVFIVSNASVGSLSSLAIEPPNLLVLANSRLQLDVKGLDETFNPVAINQPVEWTVAGNVEGSISDDGVLTVGESAGKIEIKAKSGETLGESLIEVTNIVDEIKLSQSELNVKRSEEVNLLPKVIKDEKEVFVNGDLLEWEIIGDIGTVNEDGIFIASNKESSGEIVVSYGEVKDSIKIDVGKLPVVLEDFENGIDAWEATGASYESISIKQTTHPEQTRFGKHALRIDYDFTNMPGTSGVYASTKEPISIDGYPNAIGMWVYGDGNNHWLRAQLLDGNDQAFAIDFVDEVDWTGWKYVEAPIPSGKTTPLKLDLPVRYMEIDGNKKDIGTIYIDNIRAVYGETNDDLTPPQINKIYPEDEAVVTEEIVTIRAMVHDNESGINPESIELFIDDQLVEPSYNDSAGEISYVLDELSEGLHTVHLVLQDETGNLNESVWTFIYKPEEDTDDHDTGDEGDKGQENENQNETDENDDDSNGTETDDSKNDNDKSDVKEKEQAETVNKEDNDDGEVNEENGEIENNYGGKLPKTDTAYYRLFFIGSVMVVIAGALFFLNRKQKKITR